MKKDPTEKQIQNAILDYLTLLPGTYWATNNTGLWDPVKKVHRRPGKFFRHGVSDIIGVCGNTGRIVCIEVKTPKGRVSEHQKKFLKEISESGGIAFVARSVDEVREVMVGQRT